MDFIEIIKVVILGLVEGITEWLPISSTGHMILVDEFIQLNMSAEFISMFLVVIQLGAILAVVLLYFNKLNPLSAKKTSTERKETFILWIKVLIACLPAAVIGLKYDDIIEELLFNPITVAITLIFYGILFIYIENWNKQRKFKIGQFNQLTYLSALMIGFFQMLSLIPGTSRSGATIIGAMIIGTSRYVAAEFSFFCAIPIMFGASAVKIVKYGLNFTESEKIALLTGMLVAFVVSIIAIKFLVGYIQKHDFKVFGYYRIILGIAVLAYFTLNI